MYMYKERTTEDGNWHQIHKLKWNKCDTQEKKHVF